MPKGKPGWQHGVSTTGYKKYGCRCSKCKAATAAEAHRMHLKHYVPHPKPKHVHGVYHPGCKHPECVAVVRAYKTRHARKPKSIAVRANWVVNNGARYRKNLKEYGKQYRLTTARKISLARYQSSSKRKAALQRFRESGNEAAQQFRYRNRITDDKWSKITREKIK